MSIQDILAGVVLLCLVINAADLLLTGRPGFYHFPRSGGWRFALKIGSILLVVIAVLSLVRILPSICFFAIAAAYMTALQGYAIFFRHTQKKGAL
jgi:hypothetical protein